MHVAPAALKRAHSSNRCVAGYESASAIRAEALFFTLNLKNWITFRCSGAVLRCAFVFYTTKAAGDDACKAGAHVGRAAAP